MTLEINHFKEKITINNLNITGYKYNILNLKILDTKIKYPHLDSICVKSI